MTHFNKDQYVLPYDARKNELLAQVNLLRNVPTDLTPVRQDKVIDLLERLLLRASEDLLEVNGCVHVRAHMTALGNTGKRCTVSSRQIANWRTWAEQIGILKTDFRSQRYGRREWNLFTINVAKIRDLVRAGSGLKWPEVSEFRPEGSSSPRPEGSSSPRPEGSSSPRPEGSSSPRPEGSSSPLSINNRSVETNDNRERLVVVVASCGLGKAEEAVDTALGRLGLSNDDIELRIAAWKGLPGDEQRPGTLFNWLAKRGSFEATQRARIESAAAKPRPRVPDELRKQQAAEFDRARAAALEAAASGPSLMETYLAGRSQRVTRSEI